MNGPRVIIPALLLLSFTGACAAGGEPFPSLAPRPIETLSTDEPAAPPVPAAGPADPALAAKVRPILDRGEAGAAAFRGTLAEARSAIGGAAGAETGSDAWVDAQQAISRLDAARSPVAAAIDDMDALRLAEVGRSAPGDVALLNAAAQRLGELSAEQNAALAELAGRLR